MIEDQETGALLSVGPAAGVRGAVTTDGAGYLVDLEYSDLPGPWIYHVHGQIVAGRAVITTLAISQRDPTNPVAITSQLLRKMPFGVLAERVKSALLASWENAVQDILAKTRTYVPKEGKSRPAEHFMQVAWFYVEAQISGRPPRTAVQEHWKVAQVTAKRWITEARRRGYLDGATNTAPQPGLSEAERYSQATDQIDRAVEVAGFTSLLNDFASRTDSSPVTLAAQRFRALLVGPENGSPPTS